MRMRVGRRGGTRFKFLARRLALAAAAGSAALATTSLKALVASGARTLVWTAGDTGRPAL